MKFLSACVFAALGLAAAVSGNGTPEHHVGLTHYLIFQLAVPWERLNKNDSVVLPISMLSTSLTARYRCC